MSQARRPSADVPYCVADDWGLSPGVNEGILGLCESGLVRGVSMIASAEHVAFAADRLLALDGLTYSVHLNLTHGVPLSPPAEVPSLCGPEGRFHALPALARRLASGAVSPADLRLEAARQIRALKSLGVPVTGLEGHHHVHLFPPVFAAVADALRSEGVEWVRRPADPDHAPSWLGGLAFQAWRRLAPAAPAPPLRLRPTLYLTPADGRSPAALDRKLLNARRLPVIVHPAKYDDLGRMKHPDPLRAERVAAYRTLAAWAAGRQERTHA